MWGCGCIILRFYLASWNQISHVMPCFCARDQATFSRYHPLYHFLLLSYLYISLDLQLDLGAKYDECPQPSQCFNKGGPPPGRTLIPCNTHLYGVSRPFWQNKDTSATYALGQYNYVSFCISLSFTSFFDWYRSSTKFEQQILPWRYLSEDGMPNNPFIFLFTLFLQKRSGREWEERWITRSLYLFIIFQVRL